MSSSFYGKLWIATKSDLENVVLREKVLTKLKSTQDRSYAHRLIANFVARYTVLCNNLSELYDQTLQVQKRLVIEKILVTSTQRLLELQKEMKKIEMSEFVYLDDGLVELKLTPQNIEFLCPFYFPRKRDIEVQRLIDEIPKLPEFEEIQQPTGLDKYRKVKTKEELEAEHRQTIMANAANLIKAHEKAKQARVDFLNIKLFPGKFRPKLRDTELITYDFSFQPDQLPLHRIKRTNYKTNFYRPKVNIAKFTFYEPPTFRINQLGQKVLDKRKKLEEVEDQTKDESGAEEAERLKALEDEQQLHREQEVELQNQRVAAATAIQRQFRHYQLKKAINRRIWKRKELCGLVVTPVDPNKQQQKLAVQKILMSRRERKKEFDEKFIQAAEDEKARIMKLKSHLIMEDITEDIRQWFREFYDGAKDFHRYPTAFEGGTIMVVRGETATVEEFLDEKKKTPAQKAKELEQRKKKLKEEKANKKKQAAMDKKEEKAKKKLEKTQGPTWDFADTKFASKHFGWFSSRNFRASNFNYATFQTSSRNLSSITKAIGSSLTRSAIEVKRRSGSG